MSGIVLDLQHEAIETDCDVLNLLRKAHIIAQKLQLTAFDTWILSELNGYSDYDAIPEYRLVSGSIKAWNPCRGWIPVLFHDSSIEDVLCKRKIGDAVGKIIEIDKASTDTFLFDFSADINLKLNSMCDFPTFTRFSLHIGTFQLKTIVEQVKNTILEWTIKLESEGVIGEQMQFNAVEKESAKRIPQTINNYYGNTNVISADVHGSSIIVGNSNTIERFYDNTLETVSAVGSALSNETISKEDFETAMEIMKDIQEKVSAKQKQAIVKSLLVGLKDFLIGVGASVAASLIQL